MARARNIKPSIMDNEDLAELPALHRLLFIYLWMLADREGRLEDRPKRIAAKALPYDRDADVEEILTALQRFGFIDRYQVDGKAVIQVVAFAKHQSPHVRESESELPAKEQGTAKVVPEHNLGSDEASPGSPDSLIADSLIPEENNMSGKPDVDPAEEPKSKPVKATNAQAREILAYLNARTGCDYRDVESNLSLIRARIDEGYSVQEVKAVIDDRESKWRGNDKMWPYMRPETLFGARKFSGYVGQVKPTAPGAGWWIKAGFGTPFEAENAGCSEKTAYLWQDGHRLEATV